MTTATIATTPKKTTPTTCRSIRGFALHPWFTTTNLSYRFPNFETSATALCGTTGNHILLYIIYCRLSIIYNIMLILIYIYIYCRSMTIIQGQGHFQKLGHSKLTVFDSRSVGLYQRTWQIPIIGIQWSPEICHGYFAKSSLRAKKRYVLDQSSTKRIVGEYV